MASGTLYVVATPIGNLDDITKRAIDTLSSVDIIAAEDTRHTKKLLTRFGIKTKMVSYYEHNELKRAAELVGRLKEGCDVALVSDAGTPGVSDPGYRLVKAAALALVKIVAIPGASALTAALSVSALPIDSFSFKGFLPARSTARKNFFLSLRGTEETVVVYDSPKRLPKTLMDIEATLGDIEIVIARELTKLHEEIIRGRVGELSALLKRRELKGEITLVLRTEAVKADIKDLAGELKKFLSAGLSLNEAAKTAASEFGISKSRAYKEALKIRK
ncbi:MAG: 16S rRNA (cytidine(1402)-2'-O)-methyltransferase [Thermodesulfobacteriota bacterium]